MPTKKHSEILFYQKNTVEEQKGESIYVTRSLDFSRLLIFELCVGIGCVII